MIVEGLMFAGALAVTAVIGLPLAELVGSTHKFRKHVARDTSGRKLRADVERAFTPLDLGPDPVRWPSERVWELKSTIHQADWPSKGWNDEHFGQHWKQAKMADVADRGFHAMAARRFEEGDDTAVKAAPPAHAPPSQPRRRAAAAPAAKPRAGLAERTRGPTRTEAQPQSQAQPQAQAQQARQPAPAPKQAERVVAGAPPDEAEVEHLIATVGLAGTVQAIMQRTKWDFREAAQYLARIRRDG